MFRWVEKPSRKSTGIFKTGELQIFCDLLSYAAATMQEDWQQSPRAFTNFPDSG